MSPTSVEIILAEGRFIRRTITNQDLGHQEQILSSFAESNPVFLRNVQSLGDQPVHMLVTKASLCLITQLKKLPFTCRWHYTNGILVPSLYSPQSTSVQIDDPWAPSPTTFGQLLFVQSFSLDASGFTAPKQTYLYCYRDKELFWFPYPNLFNDGRVCMGREWESKVPTFVSTKASPMSVLIAAQESFFSTKMNSDLTTDNTAQCFQRNIDGEWIYHPSATYRTFLNQCSSSHMRGFTL